MPWGLERRLNWAVGPGAVAAVSCPCRVCLIFSIRQAYRLWQAFLDQQLRLRERLCRLLAPPKSAAERPELHLLERCLADAQRKLRGRAATKAQPLKEDQAGLRA